jgi:hypothetical protein
MPPFGGYDTRLPNIGSDNNIWGYILENFLAVSFQYSATSGGVNGYLNTSVNQATTGTAGFVTLGGDLAGSSTSATSPQLVAVTTGATVGSSTQVPVITYDAKGRITSTSTASISSGTQRTFAFFAG